MSDIYMFPGCLIPTRLPYLEVSSRYVLDRLDVRHSPLPDATCCVEPIGLRSLHVEAWMVTSARMLAIAERDGRDLLTLCNGCYMSLSQARKLLMDRAERDRVNEHLDPLGLEYKGSVDVYNLAEMVHSLGEGRYEEAVTAPQSTRSVALHPGCHLTEAPIMDGFDAMAALEDIVRWSGSEVCCWGDGLCCGGGLSGAHDDLGRSMMEDTLEFYRNAGATEILTPCPFCFIQFDVRQKKGMPVTFLSEIMALAMGADPGPMGMSMHRQ